ncbi:MULTISPECIES: efflux RND transporter periplasmic adaptor subunit [unclassified Paracoccus (in: a-proteobacteria)]|uniref:efflux RND transporter periplasmic adaptor subunit n=1 Tax=unclassified Paracoccus (in: a-proteobacteria) TaxID=2688777 RepID=UPI0016036048|nr:MULTISPECIES: efflux RND transporter periplasmic adaptor subunit [unclassified Paracoccus (in: a-proteobacteria)]MBB1490392.1 efflux RND transporter periplasmic adaptor subunit [Paracoccus sp. MC1854]MBB1497234.1 efflux RND transporter periplasmic adaptor subunit [Paracoccus sp. MC1862]QQO44793.1 efflux RND transporter periplasmic adaptor subunit [Paracoccus sp. MC1862]
MRRLSLIAALFLLAPAAALPMGGAPPEQPAAGQVQAALPTVTIAAAAPAEVQRRVPLSGTLVARAQVQVYPQVEGLEIVALGAEPGDRVEAGQELVRLSDTTLRAQLAQADAELQRAVASVAQAQSQISSAEAALTQAVTALERAQSLRQSGSGTQASLDQAVVAEASARAAAASVREGLAVAQAVEAQARAAREIAQLNLDRTRITSPVEGRVASRNAELGTIASAAAGPMFILIADGSIEFQGEVIETDLPLLQPGQPVELEVAGVGRVEGRVRQLPAAVDATTRLGLVRVGLDYDDRLLTGLFASGDIITERREAVTVPASAILADASGERVQVVTDGTVETRAIDAGLLWQDRREIRAGVAAGETVIARAGAFFTTGDRVNVTTDSLDAPPSVALAVAVAPDAEAGTAAPAGAQP